MIDLELFRARIGRYASVKIYFRKMKPSLVLCSLNGALLSIYLMMLAAGVLGLILLWFNTHLFVMETKFNTNLDINYGPDIGFKMPITTFNPITWNAFIKAFNGNIKNCINIAHWNGSSSHLGKSSKGKEKVEHMKFLLNKHNIDVQGLSEANLFNSVENAEIKINKYKVLRQNLNVSRLVVYVKEDLDYKLVEELMDPDIAAIWIEVGRGKSK